jgi:hypothetical protein
VPRAPLTDVVPRRTLVIIAVVVVLAVVGAVLALTLGGNDGDADGAQGRGGSSPVASTSTKEDTGSGTAPDGEASASAPTGSGTDGKPSTGGTPSGGASPSGGAGASAGTGGDAVARTHKGGQGYSIGLPEGWKFQKSSSAGDRFTGPNGQKLLIGWTTTPKDDPVADWRNQERYMQRAQYDRIRIEKVDYRNWNAADWEFTYVDGGTAYRTVDRGFVVDDHLGYGLMYTAKAGDWHGDLRKNTWRTLTETFEPKK